MVIVVAIVLTIVTAGAFAAAGGVFVTSTGALSAAGLAATGATVGFVTGGLGAALNGGSLGDILRGAAIGAIQGAITGGVLHGMESSGFNLATLQHVVGHGIVGGVANVAMGGKFQDGFLSAAASAGLADLGVYGAFKGPSPGAVAGRTALAGLVGGTASVLGGGKFANGAYTAAFQHLLNAEMGREFRRWKAEKIIDRIQEQVDSGITQMQLARSEAQLLMEYDLELAWQRRSDFISRDFNQMQTYVGGATGDGIFFRWAGIQFTLPNTFGGIVPHGTYSGSDINYSYFTYILKIRYPSGGGLYASGGNVIYNSREFMFGNDGARNRPGAPVPFRQSLGQIPRGGEWIQAGEKLFNKGL